MPKTAGKGGSIPQGSQFQSYPQYGGMGNYMGNMGNMFGGGQMGMGGRGRGGFGNTGVPNFGTSPAGKGGGFNNFTPQRMMQEAVPMPSLQQQYAGLNQGVREFEPLGIRGYTPPVYTQAPTFDPFNRQSYFQNPTPIQDYYTPPPQMPQIPTMPNIPNIPFGPWNEPDFYDGMNQWNGMNQWDDRFNQQDYSAPPPQMRPPPYRRRTDDLRLNDRRMPWGGGLNDRPQFGGRGQQPMQPPRSPRFDPNVGQPPPMRPPSRDFMPQVSITEPQGFPALMTEARSSGGRQPTAPMTGLASLPNYIEPVRGLSADTTMYQPQMPFIDNPPESISPPMQAPIIQPIPERFGIGIDQQTMEDNPVLARRARDRDMLRMNAMKQRGMAEGGLVKFQEGGVVDGGMQLEQEVIAAVMGQHPNPDEVFKRYIDAYGEEGLMELLAAIEQMIPTEGRMVDGSGDGLNDAIPAMIDGQQPAALSKDEYVIPADVVSHAGNGSSEAGGQKFDQLVSKVRQDRTGNPVQPEAIALEELAREAMV
tara:strand:- start:604 stop:2202 length:1599 start_codon:yes stop_codon:yes gene_type:complete